jgi:hypothetical protein
MRGRRRGQCWTSHTHTLSLSLTHSLSLSLTHTQQTHSHKKNQKHTLLEPAQHSSSLAVDDRTPQQEKLFCPSKSPNKKTKRDLAYLGLPTLQAHAPAGDVLFRARGGVLVPPPHPLAFSLPRARPRASHKKREHQRRHRSITQDTGAA